MPFCVTCGSPVEGRFCQKCGTAVGAPAAPPPQPVAAAAPAVTPAAALNANGPAPPVARKTSPIVYVLIAFGVLILLVVGAVTAGGLFVIHKAREAGLDPALWERNPGLAAAKMLAATNPDAEIVSVDERSGVVVIRDKRDGKVVKINFADLKRGHVTFEGDGEKVSIGVELPSWLPPYPGAKDGGGMSGKGPDGEGGVYGFKTTDSEAAVLQFYETALRKAGYTIHEKAEAAALNALSADNGDTAVTVIATAGGGETAVNITFGAKK